MSLTKLFNGVVIVIDDEIKNKKANIWKLVDQLRAKNIPHIEYEDHPTKDDIEHWNGVSFILLDWKLREEEGELIESEIDEIIDFIKMARELCFAPIFIFTNQGEEYVKSVLLENNVYFKDQNNIIFIKSKSDLEEPGILFTEINEWIKKTPSIYALKAWEYEYYQAKNNLFNDFHEINSNWPVILWKNYKEDGVNMSKELSDIILKNLYTRMSPYQFEESILDIEIPDVKSEHVREVIEGEKFILEDKLPKNTIDTGDVFIHEDNCYINIRPSCDLIPRNGEEADSIILYLLRGSKKKNNKVKKMFDDDYGHFKDRDNQSIVFAINDGKTYVFDFKELIMKPWVEIKGDRIGRLLPPYITRMQQRYAFYLNRQGLPRIPNDAIP